MVDNNKLVFGLDTFGDVAYDEQTQDRLSYGQALRNTVEEGRLADQLGIDVLALGEHHREEYAISSPDTVLAALAMVTENITLGTGVIVLSSDDPVRVYERFSTIQALSNGRAQIMLGRGSFTESFPLFGYDLRDYEDLFEEKIALFSELLKGDPVTWEGHLTQSLENAQIYPKIEGQLDTHVGVGGSPDSVIRAAKYGFPLMLAVIGGNPYRFNQYIDLYKRAAAKFGTSDHPVGMHSHGVIADTDVEAREIAWTYLKKTMDQLGEERGWPAMSREHFEFEVTNGSYYVGSPETVAQKIARVMTEMDIERFDLVYGAGGQLQKDRFKTIQLYGEKVVPRVKELLKVGVTNE
ncbi:LLM class flavin-dependent oxidoreductase [Tetragenococcus halophilus]|uniref:LLM class flavin-dependent oxidoreductase n=1 Tax=Tetragenococcus halophilus TaxID=51669 RepID=UPI0015BB9E1C|nr:LLM class flavin-dependent oxidoreductase [Tetragenococcus halophilus]NWO00306.1 LLM class flavin-dependent oxidoreductase [Tetragenococcus halophilus]